MRLQTNKLQIEFDIEAIERDFAFIRFQKERKGKWQGAPQLDEMIGQDYQATSVLFAYGPYAYAMFKRPIDTYDLLNKFRKDNEFSDTAAVEVLPREKVTKDVDCICEAWLAQILLNSLSSSRSRYRQFHFCNLTGKLLLIPDAIADKKDALKIVEVSIDPNYLMIIEVHQYRKLISVISESSTNLKGLKTILNKPQYAIHEGTASLRRWLPRDGKSDAKNSYIKHQIANKRATLPFLDFGSNNKFQQSKSGILNQTVKAVSQHLSAYMKVSLSNIDVQKELELTKTILKRPKDLQKRLDGQEIKIVDKVESEESVDLTKKLKSALSSYTSGRNAISIGKRDKRGVLNFRIIHNATYYEENKINDKHKSSSVDFQRQNITIEDFGAESPAAIKTIVKELLIKRDLAEGKLSLFDWKSFAAKKTWSFGIYDKHKEKLILMQIEPSGEFNFTAFEKNNPYGAGEYQEIIELISSQVKNEFRTKLTFEGIVMSGDGDMNLIYRTEEITIPDLEKLEEIIKETDDELPDDLKSGEQLFSLIKDFEGTLPDIKNNQFDALKSKLKEIGKNEVKKHQFRMMLNESIGSRSKTAQSFREWLLKNHQIRLSFPKHKESLNTLFNSSLDIKYLNESDSEAYYVVGDRRESVQFSFATACKIRKVVAINGSRLLIKELLPTMNVDFVRTGRSTVVPFPFKYIREYISFSQ